MVRTSFIPLFEYRRLVSQSGYVVVDDTNHPQFDISPWPWVVNKTYSTPGDDQCSMVKNEEVGIHPKSGFNR